MQSKFLRAISFSLIFLALASWVQAEMPKTPEGKVNDFARILDEKSKTELQVLAARVENATGAQMAVVTVGSLEGLAVEDYAHKLFSLWGVGQKGKDNGILFLTAPQERKTRIEVGYGLEGTLNDGKVGRILDEAVIPFFRTGDFPKGILAGSERIAAEILKDPGLVKTKMLEPEAKSNSPIGPPFDWMLLGFFGLMLAGGAIVAGLGIHGDKLNLMVGGIFGGIPLILGSVFCHSLGLPLYILPVWALVVVLLTLAFEKKIRQVLDNLGSGSDTYSPSSSATSGSNRDPGSHDSGGSESGSSDSGSYGGGSSGGGGASRSW